VRETLQAEAGFDRDEAGGGEGPVEAGGAPSPVVGDDLTDEASAATLQRRHGMEEAVGFRYQGLSFDDDHCHVFAGVCAVETRAQLEATFRALQAHGVVTTRAGVYKPRTSPHAFQGLGAACLPWVFELAGKYGLRVIAMEVTREAHIEEVERALEAAGNPTGPILQIGTRNAQNFELLKAVGRQRRFPVLFKRGMGISLEESLNAVEYVIAHGNPRVIFCLRGVRTHLGDPHRNLVDFAHVPIVKRLTRMPVCVDPSHAVGLKERGPDGLLDLHHVTAQGLIAGASMVLVDVHPRPGEARCDGTQALLLEELPHFLADVALVRQTYEARRTMAQQHSVAYSARTAAAEPGPGSQP
jgi:3-deoxy-7-phosphoheptulonate synthase